MILNQESVILDSEPSGYTTTHRIRVEHHTLDLRRAYQLFGHGRQQRPTLLVESKHRHPAVQESMQLTEPTKRFKQRLGGPAELRAILPLPYLGTMSYGSSHTTKLVICN